ncbi:MAG: prepilin peptidase [Alphaproteobacteria bacterium]|nr:prepilin peptidase [Alphaproteobacteria bacterium]
MIIYSIFLMLLVGLAIVDLKRLLIPDIYVLLLVALGLFWRLQIQDEIGSAIGLGVLLATLGTVLAWVSKSALGQRALGGGDIKLLFVCGLWLEIENLPLFLILSGGGGFLSGIIWFSFGYGRRFPFAPSLALALMLTVDLS